MTDTELWRLDASGLSRELARGAVTPSDLLEMFIARYERLEPALNAFVVYDHEGARRAAAAATVRQKAGQRLGPLDGIPVSVKDNLFVGGLPASWGSLMYRGHVPEMDDIAVERLRAAGAVIVGKTTTPEFALMGRTQSRLSGVTRNPWNLDLTPGGSSGGATASVAAGLTPLAIGTDAGGSTRMPAAYTGLVGLRPSNGRIPRRYGFPPMALDFQAIGTFCRTMADLDLILSVLAGPDRRDPTSINLPSLETRQAPLRIGWFTRIGDETCDPEVEAAHRGARDILASCGHSLEECEPPFDLAGLRALWGTLTTVGAARAALAFEHWETDAGDQIAGLTRQGAEALAVDYVRAIDRLQAFRGNTSAAWGDYDLLLLPTTAAPAWPADQDAPATIGGKPGNGATQGMFCAWVNAMGFCGLNVPGQPHPDGRPIGLQIVAPYGLDRLALRVGHDLETHAPWAQRWPAMATFEA